MAHEKAAEHGRPITEAELREANAAFWNPPDLETLIAQQGVKPVTDFEALLGDFWPEDESIDEFISTVRRWRREGG